MNSPKASFARFVSAFCAALAGLSLLIHSASAQQVAYDEAGNYLVTANWTNGANQGFGFTPWTFQTNGTDFQGDYITTGNVPPFVIDSITNVGGTNYTNVWGLFANGTNGINLSVAYRGFSNSLGTNTFKLQWGSRGAGTTTVNNLGTQHGWCGFTLRNGNDTTGFANGVQMYLYFLDGNVPSTLYVWDGSANTVTSIPGTSFSNLGRQNITNAIEAEFTPSPDGTHYHLILKDCVLNQTLYTFDSELLLPGQSIDSVAMFCQETTGDQDYNRMQITAPTSIPPNVVNVMPTNGSIYLDATATNLAFEVDSFNSTVTSSAVTVTLNGVPQSNLSFNTAGPTNQLLATAPLGSLTVDTYYTCVIIAQDANGNKATNISTFNTFLPTDIYIDAYDYNYNSGQFVNANTPANLYAGFAGSNGIDYQIADLTGVNNTAGYRSSDLVEILPLNTDATGDPVDHANLRGNGHTAYNIGYTDTGNWENFTRVFPAANYSIYARAASGVGGQFEIEKVTNAAPTTTNQTTVALGRVSVPNTGGSKVFSGQLLPMTDLFGNTVVLPLSGTTTLRQTALGSMNYNLEYLVLVTNGSGSLAPYISTATPAPNATGVGLANKIIVTAVNRQTFVTNIQFIVDTTNITSGTTLASNAAGATLTYTPAANLPPNTNNTLTVVITDNTGAKTTNTWSFTTAPTGGVPGNGVWAGAGTDTNWNTAANWTGGTPGPGFSATFQTPGSTTNLVTNNIVSTNVTVVQLNYSTNNNGYHTTWIQPGVTLAVSNPAIASITAALQVGGVPNGDNLFNTPVTNTITGSGGTLLVTGPLQQSSNSLNFQVRQCANPSAPYQTTLDMSGLGTLIANVGKFYVAQGGAGANQSNVSGRVYLAMTNTINLLRVNAGQFEVGDSSGGAYTLPGSALYLGKTNAIFVDTARIGKQKATNNLLSFNPAFTNNNANPVATIRGTNGSPTGRVTTFTIGDADTDTVTPINVDAVVDFSGGTVNALVSTMILGEGCTSATDTGHATGTLTMTAGTIDVLDLKVANQRAANSAPATATVNVLGSGTLLCSNIELAHFTASATGPVTGTLNIGGTVRANITPEGGTSIVNLNGGTLIVSNTAGTSAAPLSQLNLTGGSLHLNVNGTNTAPNVFATAITTSGTTVIRVDSVSNITSTTTVHLIGYTGTDPFAGLSLGAMPAGYSGTLVDNSGSVDLTVNISAVPPAPTIRSIAVSGGQVVLGGTNNNNGAGGTYSVLTSTSLNTPLSNWTVITNGTFTSGVFSSTNSASTNSQRFFILRAP